MLSVLVTGGAGFIGHHLIRRLLQDHRVVIIDNMSTGKLSNIPKDQNALFYNEDLRNSETILDIIKRERIDVCMHLAANTDITGLLADSNNVKDININSTASILRACAECNVGRFVFASTAAVYGEARTQPIPEDHELRPISPYGDSKLECEKLVESFQKLGKIQSSISLRFFNVYGKGQNPQYAGVITKFAERLSKNLPPQIRGDGNQTRDFISVRDVVDAIILAMQSDAVGEFNIGTGKATSIRDLAYEMTNNFGLEMEPKYEDGNSSEIIHSCANTDKAKKILKFVAKIQLRDGLGCLF